MKKLTEKIIVNEIISHWEKFFKKEKINFQKKEWQALPEYRADLLCYLDIDLKKLGFTEKSEAYRASMVIECKYNNNDRDLIYELKKAIYIRNFMYRLNKPFFIGVITDNYSDKHINKFLKDNNIFTWELKIKDNKLNTLEIKYYNL